ncbi:hypothetical protein [Vibrio algivorus]|uniref:hypothetical protein n=1 Tax=Vibrio algivorus TaxID=1667024 RepID=UPI0016432F9E|nr:hypothetical protein [Vibrio algivorus]
MNLVQIGSETIYANLPLAAEPIRAAPLTKRARREIKISTPTPTSTNFVQRPTLH